MHTRDETENPAVRRWLWTLLLIPLVVFAILLITQATLR
jgi:hypothetical protein